MPEERQRFVYKEWVRDPKGKLLEKPPPKGKRTDNNIIWGHTLDDFYWIPRIPGVNVLTIWSRSMIQAYGENYLKEKHDEEPEPRRLHPWPVLTLPDHLASTSTLGYIDEDCGQVHERSLRRFQDEVAETPKVAPSSKAKTTLDDRNPVAVNPVSSTSSTKDSGNIAAPVPGTIAPGTVAPGPIAGAAAPTASSVPPPPQDASPVACDVAAAAGSLHHAGMYHLD
ncbi:hypothetical protein FB451DRAFT_164532 [Mycena latifolia]|nr:hypothetical protein FB451DRAFT_164532 [Mycena latifolia]